MDTFVSKNWTNMIRPVALEIDNDVVTRSYGKFVAKPLERGYGQTLGNSLRSFLLSRVLGLLLFELMGFLMSSEQLITLRKRFQKSFLTLKK